MLLKSLLRSTRIFCAAAFAAIMMAEPAAAYVNVYGGPTYIAGVGGFKDGHAIGVNDTGIAIGTAHKYDASDADLGERAFRWNATAATELGNLGSDVDGVAHGWAVAINDAGTVVGAAERHDGSGEFVGVRAVCWDASGTAAAELGHLGTDANGVTWSGANAINDAGTIVGIAEDYDGSGEFLASRAVRWDGSGTVATELQNLASGAGGSTSGYAHSINNAGTVFGNADKYDSEGNYQSSHAVRWDALSATPTELGNLGTDASGYSLSRVNAINEAGTAVGIAEIYGGSGEYVGVRAVRWDASSSVATDLGILATGPSSLTYSQANDINDAGIIVGLVDTYDGSGDYLGARAVRWAASSTVAVELGNLGTDPNGYTDSDAFAINDAGFAVGFAVDYDGSGTLLGDSAVYWDPDGAVVDLNALVDPTSGWTLEQANAISDTGWIAGHGTFDPDGPGEQDAYVRMFLMQIPALGVLPGDYNHDGAVDAADYVVWRKTDSSPDDYDDWQTNFARSLALGSAASDFNNSSDNGVPEPTSGLLLLLAAVGFVAMSRHGVAAKNRC